MIVGAKGTHLVELVDAVVVDVAELLVVVAPRTVHVLILHPLLACDGLARCYKHCKLFKPDHRLSILPPLHVGLSLRLLQLVGVVYETRVIPQEGLLYVLELLFERLERSWLDRGVARVVCI